MSPHYSWNQKERGRGAHWNTPKPLTKDLSFSIFDWMPEIFIIQYFVLNGLKRILSVSMVLGVLFCYLTSRGLRKIKFEWRREVKQINILFICYINRTKAADPAQFICYKGTRFLGVSTDFHFCHILFIIIHWTIHSSSCSFICFILYLIVHEAMRSLNWRWW